MKKTIELSYSEIPIEKLNDNQRILVEMAIGALDGSHSSYSNFSVGAAVVLDNGHKFCGANQENVSYPCSTCAERSVINYAQSVFPNACITAIAIVARKKGASQIEDFVSPCGMCRQVLVEVERNQSVPLQVFLVGQYKTIIFNNAKDLLPLAFEF